MDGNGSVHEYFIAEASVPKDAVNLPLIYAATRDEGISSEASCISMLPVLTATST